MAIEQPWLSHCVAGSIRRLLESAPAGRKLTGADIFADIAKHGTGSSVERLRQHAIQPKDVDVAIARATRRRSNIEPDGGRRIPAD